MEDIMCKAVLKNGGWLEEFYLNPKDGTTYFVTDDPNVKISIPVRWFIYPESICMFSGYLDKYGRKIYENDYVKIEGRLYKVVFETEKFILIKVKLDCQPYMHYLRNVPQMKIELLGNLYDKQE
jgi:hypothetical protein